MITHSNFVIATTSKCGTWTLEAVFKDVCTLVRPMHRMETPTYACDRLRYMTWRPALDRITSLAVYACKRKFWETRFANYDDFITAFFEKRRKNQAVHFTNTCYENAEVFQPHRIVHVKDIPDFVEMLFNTYLKQPVPRIPQRAASGKISISHVMQSLSSENRQKVLVWCEDDAELQHLIWAKGEYT